MTQTNPQQAEAEYISARFASALDPFGREAYEQAYGLSSGEMYDFLPFADWSEAEQLNALAGQTIPRLWDTTFNPSLLAMESERGGQ